MTGLIWGSLAVVLGAFCLLTVVIITCLSFLMIVQFFAAVKNILKKKRENGCGTDGN